MAKVIKFLKPIILFCILLSFTCCINEKGNDKSDTQAISIDLEASKDLSDEIESLQVIKLIEEEGKYPGDYSKVVCKGDSMYILDSFSSKGLYLYDSEYKLINSYRKFGHGPDEFLSLTDFVINNDGIQLLDTYTKPNRILLDPELKFLRKEDAEDMAIHFYTDSIGGIWYDRGNIAYGTNKSKLVYLKDDSRKSVLEIPENLENITFSNLNSFCQLSDGKLLYLPILEPYIYECKDGKATKYLKLDFGDKWPIIENNASDTHPLELMRKFATEGKVIELNIFSDNDNLALTFKCQDVSYIMIIDTNEKNEYRLLKYDNSVIEKFGSFLSMRNDSLIFGGDGKLVIIDLKS